MTGDGWDEEPAPVASEDDEEARALLRKPNDFDAEPPRRQHRKQEQPDDMQKLLPASVDAEQGVLASFLLAPNDVGAMCQKAPVVSGDFHSPGNAIIYGVMLQMHEAGQPIDIVTLTQELHDRNLLLEAGGAAYVTDLFRFLPTAANAAHYIGILEEKRKLRRMIEVCTKASGRCYSEQDNVDGILEDIERDVLAIRRQRKDHRGFTGRDVALIGMDALQHKWERMGQISGISTGFPDLDRKTDGLHPTEMIVLAARPSLGKSALAFNIAEHLAIGQKLPVGILSLEMGRKQLSERLIASYARVNTAPWRYGVKPSAEEMQQLQDAAYWYSESPFHFEELSDPTIQEVRAIGRRMVREHGIKLLIIDSLSVLRSSSKQGRDNRTREVAEAAEGTKEMAKELEIPVILIAHLDRGMDKVDKNGKPIRPVLADLRESGAIEQAADSVWMLWQPEPDVTELWIPKCRNGERYTSVPMEFQKEFARFNGESQDADSQQQHLL